MKKRLVCLTALLLMAVPLSSVSAQDQEIEKFLNQAYEQNKKSPNKAILLGLIPSMGHMYVGYDTWKNRGIFFLLGEGACITVQQTLGYSTLKSSIGPGIYEELPNQTNFIFYASIMAFTALKIYELWDVKQQVEKYNQAIKQRYDLTFSKKGDRTRLGLTLRY